MPLNPKDRIWYYDQIEVADPKHKVVKVDRSTDLLTYNSSIRSDESRQRQATEEEIVRALAVCMLASKDFKYSADSFYIEKYFKHGHPSSKHDEVDLIIYDMDDLPFAMWEFKSAEEYDKDPDQYIQYQLFGTAPLVGSPKLLVYATIKAEGSKPRLTMICIDRTKHQSYDTWKQEGRPHSKRFPEAYSDPKHEPFTHGGKVDLRLDCTQADFRGAAATFHAEFFSEHPDNTIFTNIMKCLLAKIYDERQTKKGQAYQFQVLYKKGKEETAAEAFARVNNLYKTAYTRYIEPEATEPDEISAKEFPPERVKTIINVLQGMSITRGAALHSDVIGAFFEEILRTGFKQDKGMYFTHANLVYFILEALDLDGLTAETWKTANHPDNRLPYVIDPACGSGTFLLRAMHIITNAIRSRKEELVTDLDAIQFFTARMSDTMPNYWAEHFIYGMDPKFVMAITAKINMVLHGDGSAHIFKHDALKPLSTFADYKLKPINDPYRTVPRSRYNFDVGESFDLVISNPPFGITLASDTRAALPTTYSVKITASSECYFLERWFQLLKPKGRLGVVVPESLLNTADNAEVRVFLYRTFWIKAIVSLPRNLFIETPTLTSLLFCQKKTAQEIEMWDNAWSGASANIQNKVGEIETFLREAKDNTALNKAAISEKVTSGLTDILFGSRRITKKGKGPVDIALPMGVKTSAEACRYYLDLIKLAAFGVLVRNAVFREVCKKMDYSYHVYMVDEVGYKLSKRKERLRPNQLCRFIGSKSKKEIPNLHLAGEPVELVINTDSSERILDYIRRDVKWS